MEKSTKLVHITVADNRCFFHVFGDKHQYYDLESMAQAHPELKEYCCADHIALEMEIIRQKEILGFTEKF